MQIRGSRVTVVERPEAGGTAPHLAALVAAARAHPGAVVALVSGTEELARAVDGPPESILGAPGWGIRFEASASAQARRRAALIDRDGTVMEDRHYLADPAGVTLLPGALDGLRALSDLGIMAVILTNQSGVARGLVTLDQLTAIHTRLEGLLHAGGVELGGIFACPHTPDAGCECRKPADGLARRAALERGFDLAEAVVVGDMASDLELGHRLGVPAILVGTGNGPATLAAGSATADYLVDDLTGLAPLLSHPGGLPVPEPAFTA